MFVARATRTTRTTVVSPPGRGQPGAMADAGFRVLPHVADLILEAWGPDREACLAAAARGLVATFAEPGDSPPDRRVEVAVDARSDEDLVVRLLEAVVFLVDAEGRVPLTVTVAAAADGVRASFDTVAVDAVTETGALPKGVSRSGVVLAPEGGRWHCRVVVDV